MRGGRLDDALPLHAGADPRLVERARRLRRAGKSVEAFGSLKPLLRSHAAGLGPEVEREVVRAMMLLRVRSLAMGYSGARREVAEGIVGRARFLAVYLVGGLAGSVMVLWLASPGSSTLGASGAIFGLMAALLIVAVKVRGDVQGLLTLVAVNVVVSPASAGFGMAVRVAAKSISWSTTVTCRSAVLLAALPSFSYIVFAVRAR